MKKMLLRTNVIESKCSLAQLMLAIKVFRTNVELKCLAEMFRNNKCCFEQNCLEQMLRTNTWNRGLEIMFGTKVFITKVFR